MPVEGDADVPIEIRAPQYELLMLSSIPVIRSGEGYESLDLWVVDLAAQIEYTKRFCLVCPVVGRAPEGWQGSLRLPSGIEVVPLTAADNAVALRELLKRFDVIQVNAGQGWCASRLARRMVGMAHQLGVTSIVGISSDRAKTTLMNARPRALRQLPAAVKSLVRYLGLRATYLRLTAATDGTFIVGAGLRSLVSKRSTSVHVSTASWIKDADLTESRSRYLLPNPEKTHRVCLAARLERMKGVHIGIEAFRKVSADDRLTRASLKIFGAGPERSSLEAQVRESGLSDRVTFGGTLAYPQKFLNALQQFDIVVISNLNVEQPRLVFDAISQGCIPLCPDNNVYRSLGLPSEILYKPGDPERLGELLSTVLLDQFNRVQVVDQLLAVGARFTLESMHRLRAEWVAELLSTRRLG